MGTSEQQKQFDKLFKCNTDGGADCECHFCIKEKGLTGSGGMPLNASKMILCGKCGNKRCPKASNHRNTCTGSNEPGQSGSVYPKALSLPATVVFPKKPVEDLKVFAGKVCIDIFNDFDATEIGSQPTSIRRAWDIGRELADA